MLIRLGNSYAILVDLAADAKFPNTAIMSMLSAGLGNLGISRASMGMSSMISTSSALMPRSGP